MKPNDSESVGEVSDESKVYIHDENITLSLDYHKSSKQGNSDNSFQEISKPVKVIAMFCNVCNCALAPQRGVLSVAVKRNQFEGTIASDS